MTFKCVDNVYLYYLNETFKFASLILNVELTPETIWQSLNIFFDRQVQ